MIEDMLEAEIETLWRQRERAYWIRNTPDFSFTRVSAIGGLTVLLLCAWPLFEVFQQDGFFPGLFLLGYVLGIWFVPVTIVEQVRKRRRSRRPAPGTSPDSAEDIRYLRMLQQQDIVKVGDRFWPPNLKVFNMWMREGATRANKRQRAADERQSNERLAALNRPFTQAKQQKELDDEHARQERIRILLSPYQMPDGHSAASDAKHPNAAGKGKSPGRFSGPGSDS